jgi:PAS domain S-box-containing protein
MSKKIFAKKSYLESDLNADRKIFRYLDKFIVLSVICIFLFLGFRIVVQMEADRYAFIEELRHKPKSFSREKMVHELVQFEMSLMKYYFSPKADNFSNLNADGRQFLNSLYTHLQNDKLDTLISKEYMDLKETVYSILDNIRDADASEESNIELFLSYQEKLHLSISVLLDHLTVAKTAEHFREVSQKYEIVKLLFILALVLSFGLILLLLKKLSKTEKLLSERRLLAHMLELRLTAIEKAMDGIIIINKEGRIQYANESLVKLHGCKSFHDIEGKAWQELYADEEVATIISSVRETALNGGRVRISSRGKRLDGTFYDQDLVIVQLGDDGYICIIRDNTELVESIRISNNRLAAIEAASDGVGIVDEKGNLIYLNKSFKDLYGITDKDISSYIGVPWTELYDEREQNFLNNHVISTLLTEGRVNGQVRMRLKKGNDINVEYTINVLPDGGLIGVVRDVSERLNAEYEKMELQRKFLQAQKMEAIGRMAGGIAHDFNNILASILGYTELLLDDLEEGSAPYKFSKQIQIGGQQARHMIDQILAFSRRHEEGGEKILLNDIIDNIKNIIYPMVGQNISLKVSTLSADNKEQAYITGNTSSIMQSILNLCVNAIDAVKNVESPRLSLRSYIISSNDDVYPTFFRKAEFPSQTNDETTQIIKGKNGTITAYINHLKADEQYGVIEVEDNGYGMTADILDHIFEPFFTTKPAGQGTGLGLSAVLGIVMSHKGAMVVRTKKDEGSLFRVLFPITEINDDEQMKVGTNKINGSGCILVVDDQQEVGTIISEMLASLGYEVKSVMSAYEAIDEIRENLEKYDLIISDYSMPDMNGVEMAKTISTDCPDVPIIIVTGHGRNRMEDEISHVSSIKARIKKPLDRASLSHVVDSVINKKG